MLFHWMNLALKLNHLMSVEDNINININYDQELLFQKIKKNEILYTDWAIEITEEIDKAIKLNG
jgi:hypothetical protein